MSGRWATTVRQCLTQAQSSARPVPSQAACLGQPCARYLRARQAGQCDRTCRGEGLIWHLVAANKRNTRLPRMSHGNLYHPNLIRPWSLLGNER
jgi:hypothetical protein